MLRKINNLKYQVLTLRNINENIIVGLRNPITAIPTFFNEKELRYRYRTGQAKENYWQQVRDDFFEYMVEEWLQTIRIWKRSDFKVEFYLEYEDLMDYTKGIKVLQKLRSLLQSSGFAIVPEEDIPCIWINSIGEERLRRYYNNNYYEYTDYVPKFKKQQAEYLVAAMNFYIKKFTTDERLKTILKRYVNEINSAQNDD